MPAPYLGRRQRAMPRSVPAALSRPQSEHAPYRRIRAVTMTGLRPVRWRPDHLHMSETPASARLRRAVRAIILADDDRVLLCRFGFPHPAVPAGATVVWAA